MSNLTASNPTPQPGGQFTLTANWDTGLTLSYALLDVRAKAPGSTVYDAWVRADQSPYVTGLSARRVNSPGPFTWSGTLATADGTTLQFRASPQGGGTAMPIYTDVTAKAITYVAARAKKVYAKTKAKEELPDTVGLTLNSITVMARKVGNPTVPLSYVLRSGAANALIEQGNFPNTVGTDWAPVSVALQQSRHITDSPKRVVLAAGAATSTNYYEIAPYPKDPGEGSVMVSTDDGATWSVPAGSENDSFGIFGYAAVDAPTDTPVVLPPAPVAALDGWQDNDPASPTFGMVVLDASASTGTAIDYGFTDETGAPVGPEERTNPKRAVPLPAPGDHTYTVTVEETGVDNPHRQSTATKVVTVTAPPPVANFEIRQGIAGQLIFDSSKAVGQGLVRQWTITGQTKMPVINWDEGQVTGWGMFTIEDAIGVPAPVTATLKVTDAQGRTSTYKATRQPIHDLNSVAQYDSFNPTELKWGPPHVGRPFAWTNVSAVNDPSKDRPNLEPIYEDGKLIGHIGRVVGSDDRVTQQGGIRIQFGLPGGSVYGTADGYAMANPDPWGQRIGPRASGQSSGRLLGQPRFMRWEFMLPPENEFPLIYTGWVYTYRGGIKIDPATVDPARPLTTGKPMKDASGWIPEEAGTRAVWMGVSTNTGTAQTITRDGISIKRLSGSDAPYAGEPKYADRADIHNFGERHGAAPGSSTVKIGVDRTGKMIVGVCNQFIDKVWSTEKEVPLFPVEASRWYRIIEETKMRTRTDELAGDRGYVRWHGINDDGTTTILSMGVPSFPDANGQVITTSDGKIMGAFNKTFGPADTRNSEAEGLAGQCYVSPDFMKQMHVAFRRCAVGLSIADVLNKDAPVLATAA